ncbi:helix-turn-helix domain-containing protein [Streptomyces sp. NPDC056296]|uniref:helix-turn-helix domain-containing protein n=1 Tax=Streptomyces sp. NPDC056296 TaxID=3345775 RepID=UPI0035E12E25
MGTQNPSAPSRAQSAPAADPPRTHHHGSGGVIHENTRHTTRFVVIGNHLAQHKELSLLAIGLACHIQSLPTGASIDIKSLTTRFPEGPTRIASALRELETYGYLRRELVRTPTGRIVTRTVSCNQPTHRREAADTGCSDQPARQPRPAVEQTPQSQPQPRPPHGARTRARARKALPAVPQPSGKAPSLLRAATDLLTSLRRHDSRLLLSAAETAHLAPGVATWLERDIGSIAVRQALTTDLPDEPLRRPAALLAHRLTDRLPPPAPFRAPTAAPPLRHPVRNCDGCDRGFRAPETEARCRDCRTPAAIHP